MSTSAIKHRASRQTRLMQSAAHKLERHKTLLALSLPEYRAARELVRDAAALVNEHIAQHPKSKKLPRVFLWRGGRYWLEYSTFGRVYVRMSGSKARFPSGPLAI